jgi:hypothetical protein
MPIPSPLIFILQHMYFWGEKKSAHGKIPSFGHVGEFWVNFGAAQISNLMSDDHSIKGLKNTFVCLLKWVGSKNGKNGR